MENNVKIKRNYFVLILIIFGIFSSVKSSESNMGDEAQQYDMYYLSANGTDLSTCGKTADSACKSLKYVLGIYYNRSEFHQPGLSIITSKSLTINQQVMVGYPNLAKSKLIISASERMSDACTIFLNNINFLNSYWILSNVNLEMVNCNAASLILELNHLVNVTIQNCTFGNWTFRQTQDIFVGNVRNIYKESISTSLSFYNSSAHIEDMTIEHDNDITDLEGITVQEFSYLYIGHSTFVNNTVKSSLITVLNSSFLIMSNCTVLGNYAKEDAGAIYAFESGVNLTNTYFYNNKANRSGGAIFAEAQSWLQIENCTFIKNEANLSGGAIHLVNFSEADLFNVFFNRNMATLGGAIHLADHSTLNANDLFASQNAAFGGSVTAAIGSCNMSCENCFLSENIAEDKNGTTSIQISKDSMVNEYDRRYLRQRGKLKGCIYAKFDSTVSVSNSSFTMNTGSAVAVSTNSKLNAVNSNFVNNSIPSGGGAILSTHSSLMISYSLFDSNKANGGGAIYQETSKTKLNQCLFLRNSDSAVVGFDNNEISMENSYFENNFGQFYGGAVSIFIHGVLNVSNTTFRNNKQKFSINLDDLQTIDTNGTGGGGGAIWLSQSVGNIYKSRLYNNYASYWGGSIYISENSIISISDTTFENNVASVFGGAISILNSSMNIESSTFKNNTVLNKEIGMGGGLFFTVNCTANISNVLFSKCHATRGGAMVTNFTKVIMVSSLLNANTGSALFLLDGDSYDINNCTFFNNSMTNNGGAISCLISCDVKMANSNFTRNKAIVSGGAVLVWTMKRISTFTAHNCSFTDNSAYTGGAISVASSNLSISDSIFSNNMAQFGGVVELNGNIVIKNCHITNNTAYEQGGVITAVNASLQMSNCLVSNNTANNDAGVGMLRESRAVITSCIFEMNSAFGGGGGVFLLNGGRAILKNSSFVKNVAELSGGVLYVYYGTVIKITRSCFFGNQAKYIGGTLVSLFSTKVLISDTEISENSANSFGAIVIDSNSVLELNHSQVVNNRAQESVGALHISNNSLLVAVNSSFKGNRAHGDSAMGITNSTAYLENCTFMENIQAFLGGTIAMANAALKVANTYFIHNVGYAIFYYQPQVDFINRLETYKCLFQSDNISLKSNMILFEQVAIREHIISNRSIPYPTRTITQETPYASILPQPCLHNCTCYSSPWQRVNIFDCKNKGLTSLPETVLEGTEGLLLSGNNLRSLSKAPDYLKNITLLNLSSSNISDIDETFIIENVKSLDIRGNKLKILPGIIKTLNGTSKLWISNNPYECNCDTLWMKDWLIDAENVMDKRNVTCSSGVPIYKLDKASLGCFGDFPLWKIITLAVVSTVVIVTVIIIARKWKTIKFHYYARFTKDDDSQDLSEMTHDAFVSCSWEDQEFTKTEIIEYLKQCGFRICWHETDFRGGTYIAENIAEANEHSRRIILVISKAYVHSHWCMTEFRQAHAHATGNGRNKFMIPILFGDTDTRNLFKDVNFKDEDTKLTELKLYLETHTYINCNNVELMKNRLLEVMPHIPLLKLRPEVAELDKNTEERTEDIGNNDVVNGHGEDETNVNDNVTCEHDSQIPQLDCCFCVKRIFFRRTQSDNDEIPLVEM